MSTLSMVTWNHASLFCSPSPVYKIQASRIWLYCSMLTHPKQNSLCWVRLARVLDGRGQNTDPQSMDYLNGLPKWTTPESHLKGEKRLFEARHIIVLTIPYAFALETFHTCDPLVSLHNPNPNPNPSNSCCSPFKWLSGVVHLGNPFRQSMDWSVFCPLPVLDSSVWSSTAEYSTPHLNNKIPYSPLLILQRALIHVNSRCKVFCSCTVSWMLCGKKSMFSIHFF